MKEVIRKIRKLRKNRIQFSQKQVRSDSRPIRAKFTREIVEDLKSFNGLDSSKLLEDCLVEELKKKCH
jgi:hypothetical protein